MRFEDATSSFVRELPIIHDCVAFNAKVKRLIANLNSAPCLKNKYPGEDLIMGNMPIAKIHDKAMKLDGVPLTAHIIT